MLAPSENSIVVAEKPPALRLYPITPSSTGREERAHDAAAPHNLQSTLSGPGQSRHNVDDRSLTQLFVKTGVHASGAVSSPAIRIWYQPSFI